MNQKIIHPHELLPTRAHRRFLQCLAPTRLPGAAEQEYVPIERVVLAAELRQALQIHLSTAGETRSGLLMGYVTAQSLQVDYLLPAGYAPLFTYEHPFALDSSYILGVTDALRQASITPMDWVGQWIMPADGLAPREGWVQAQFQFARRQALVGVDLPLLTFGQGDERIEVKAWVADPDDPLRGSAVECPVEWSSDR